MIFKIMGLIVGAVFGFLVFSYEHGGGGGGGDSYNVYICGIAVYQAGGYFVDIFLAGARLLVAASVGFAGFFITGKIVESRVVKPAEDGVRMPVDHTNAKTD